MSVNEHRPPPADKKFESLEYTDEHSRTFVFGDEDHTLGNSLRHVLMGRKETTFCGYSVPHPSEPKMNVRLQTSTSKTAVEVLKDGLHELVEICDLFDFTLDSAIAGYEAREKDAGAESKGQSKSV
ncbi:dna-directed rna polymerase i and iii subunit rpc19 [Nannochloropsis oceanica]